jgi:hypothetical protein
MVLATPKPGREIVLGGGTYPMLAVSDDPGLVERFGEHGLRFTVSLEAPFTGLWWVRSFEEEGGRTVANLAVFIARTVWGLASPKELRWCRRQLHLGASSKAR